MIFSARFLLFVQQQIASILQVPAMTRGGVEEDGETVIEGKHVRSFRRAGNAGLCSR